MIRRVNKPGVVGKIEPNKGKEGARLCRQGKWANARFLFGFHAARCSVLVFAGKRTEKKRGTRATPVAARFKALGNEASFHRPSAAIVFLFFKGAFGMASAKGRSDGSERK